MHIYISELHVAVYFTTGQLFRWNVWKMYRSTPDLLIKYLELIKPTHWSDVAPLAVFKGQSVFKPLLINQCKYTGQVQTLLFFLHFSKKAENIYMWDCWEKTSIKERKYL